MVHLLIPLPGLSRDFSTITEEEKNFIAYFSALDMDCMSPVVDSYAGIGPQGYGTDLMVAPASLREENELSQTDSWPKRLRKMIGIALLQVIFNHLTLPSIR